MKEMNSYSREISQSQIVPFDIVQMIQQKYKKSQNQSHVIYINPVQESSKIIDSSIQKQNSQDQLLKLPNIYQRNSFKSVGIVCRICSLPESKGNPLYRVCRCFRSKKYVHEYCLKKQIIEKYRSRLKSAKCEICQETYQMELKIQKNFQPHTAWQQSKDKLPLFCLLVFLIVMIVIVILLSMRLAETGQSTNRRYFLESKSFLIIFVIFSFIVISILIWFIAMIVKGLLFVEKIILWKILEFKPLTKSILNKNIVLVDFNQSPLKKVTLQPKPRKRREHTVLEIPSSDQIREETTQRNNITAGLFDPRSTRRARFSLI